MNSVKLFILFAATVLTAEATFVLGTGTLAVTGAGAGLAALLGIKAAAVGGLALGAALSRRRHYYRPSYRRARYIISLNYPWISFPIFTHGLIKLFNLISKVLQWLASTLGTFFVYTP